MQALRYGTRSGLAGTFQAKKTGQFLRRASPSRACGFSSFALSCLFPFARCKLGTVNTMLYRSVGSVTAPGVGMLSTLPNNVFGLMNVLQWQPLWLLPPQPPFCRRTLPSSEWAGIKRARTQLNGCCSRLASVVDSALISRGTACPTRLTFGIWQVEHGALCPSASLTAGLA